MKNLRLMLVAVVAALIGGMVACSADQAPFECISSSGTYWVKYMNPMPSGTCVGDPPPGEEMVLHRYGSSTTAFTMAVRSSTIASPYFSDNAQRDTTTPDPDGLKINSIGSLPFYPTNNVCKVGALSDAVENYDAAIGADGGIAAAATSMSYAWTNFSIINSANIPATVFTAQLTTNIDGCVRTYDTLGMVPAVTCSSDADCNPVADPASGRFTGSGINPDFKPKCTLYTDTDADGVLDSGYCEISVPLASIPR